MSLSLPAIHGAAVAATLPGTARFAEAGPFAPSSAAVAPANLGKSAGTVSQMRPHSVSVWPVAAVPLVAVGLAAVALDDVAVPAGAAMSVARGLEGRLAGGLPLCPGLLQPATTTTSAATRTSERRFMQVILAPCRTPPPASPELGYLPRFRRSRWSSNSSGVRMPWSRTASYTV